MRWGRPSLASPAPPGMSFRGQGAQQASLMCFSLDGVHSHPTGQSKSQGLSLDTQSDLSKVGSQDRRMGTWGATLSSSLTHSGHVVKTASTSDLSLASSDPHTLCYLLNGREPGHLQMVTSIFNRNTNACLPQELMPGGHGPGPLCSLSFLCQEKGDG